MFSFIHAADIHLDSPLRGLERYESAPVDTIRHASRRAFENLVDLAIAERVDFVVIAGDLYDGNWKDYHTGLYMVKQLTRLKAATIPVFLITGNHDADNKMTKKLPFPENVTVFSSQQPETHQLPDLGVALHGQGFATAKVTKDLSQNYPAGDPKWFNIGLLHTCVTGREGHEAYAPCTIEGLISKEYQYWALGHIHQREFLREADPVIAFSGNLQGRHIRETGEKGCLLVTVDDQHHVTTQFQALDVFRWYRCEVDATDAETGGEILDRFAGELGSLMEASEDRPLAVRVEITGACVAHEQLAANPHGWMNEVRARAVEEALDHCWIEKVKLRTRLPEQQQEHSLKEGPLGELVQLVDEVRQGGHLAEELGSGLQDLTRKVSPTLLAEIPLEDPNWLAEMLDQVEQMLIGKLMGNSEA